MSDVRRIGVVVGLAFVVAACGGDDIPGEPANGSDATITLSSAAFADQTPIPERYTCDGRDIPPALTWEGVPEATVSLALVMEDPDAPTRTFMHWTVWDIPRDAPGFTGSPPPLAGAKEGTNDGGSVGYTGPCPPAGAPHRYVFTLYALDEPLSLDDGAAPPEVLSAINSHEIARGMLTGIYARS